MLLPLALLALLLPGTSDAGPPAIAPVAPAPGVRPAPGAETQQKPLDLAQMPFTPDSITQVVRAHQPEIQACYEKTLAARNEKLQGRVATRFVIGAAGTVSSAEVLKQGTTLKDKDLQSCVVGVLRQLRFPKPPDGKNHPVEYPFNLQPIE